MKLSTRSRYGLRILLQIAIENRNGKLAQGKLISEKQNISEPYLEQIMITLRSSGLVKTVRGCNGGYGLNKNPEEITVLEVVELFEGELKIVDCSPGKKRCPRLENCLTTTVWKKLSDALRKSAASITLKEIVDQRPDNSGNEYFI